MSNARWSGFQLLWAGQAASLFGSQVGDTAVRLLAATTLAATPFQLGLLSAAQTVGFLLIALPAGVLADQVRRRPVLIACDLVRAVLLAAIPLAWWFGALSFPGLLVVVVAAGLAQVVFDVTYQSYVPALVGRDRLIVANGRLESSRSTAVAGGPALGGTLTQLVSAAGAITVTSLGYLASALLLWRIPDDEPVPARRARHCLRAGIAEGLRFVLGDRLLRATTTAAVIFNVCYGIMQPLVVVLLVTELGLPGAVVGVLLSLAGAGGLTGALLSGRIAAAVGRSRAIWLAELACVPAFLLLPLAFGSWGPALFGTGYFALHVALAVFNVSNLSFRQAICPGHLLGRMNASVRFLMWGALPIGALTGGALGAVLGVRWSLVLAGAGVAMAALVLLLSPLRTMRDLPATVAA